MTKVVEIPNRLKAREEAAKWVAKLDAGNMTTHELRELRSWLEQSPVHVEEMESMVEIWDNLDVLASYRTIIIEPQRTLIQRFWIPASIAACLAVLSSSLLFVNGYFQSDLTLATTQVYETKVGEQKNVLLSDGSSVRMNTASKLDVQYDKKQRTVHLQEGEVFFEVEADNQRPFVVETELGLVTAIGTAFSVRLNQGDIQVAVSEGIVKLSSKKLEEGVAPATSSQQIQDVVTVTAGQVASLKQDKASIQTLEPKKIFQRLAWKDGMLIFEGDTLETVIKEVSRYTSIEISIPDPELKQVRIGGYFRIGEIDSLLQALEKGFNVRVEQVNKDRILLHPAAG